MTSPSRAYIVNGVGPTIFILGWGIFLSPLKSLKTQGYLAYKAVVSIQVKSIYFLKSYTKRLVYVKCGF